MKQHMRYHIKICQSRPEMCYRKKNFSLKRFVRTTVATSHN